jgi:O-methyltransferase
LVWRSLFLSNNIVQNDERFISLFWQLTRENRMLLSIREAYNIYFYSQPAFRLGGAVAELGVYKGGGAKLLSETKGSLPLYLFDTFAGMPEVNKDIDRHRKDDFCDTSLCAVQQYLSGYPGLHFQPGFFPDTTCDLPANTEFCFVHLDVDIYESTLAGLKYFYPRLKKGGILISHDYYAISCPGVKKAFDEFFSDKKEEVLFLWDTQCLVRKQN